MESISTPITNTMLSNKIEETRKKLIQYGLENGFTDKRTVLLSQELDELINEYLYAEKQEKIV